MQLEEICCSLEYAQTLKSVGIKQKSLFSWFEKTSFKSMGISGCSEATTISTLELSENHKHNIVDKYSAFTASELLNILGSATWKNLLLYGIPNVFQEHKDFVLESELFADALSKIIINLIENKLVSVEEINERV